MSNTEKRNINKESKQLIENYLNMLYGDNRSDNTIDNYKIDLEMFVEYMESKDLSITEATLEQLEGYKAHLRNVTYGNGKKYSENTRARRISSLKSFYEYLYDREIILRNPSHKLTIPKVEQGAEPIYMSKEEAQSLITATKGSLHEFRDKIILIMFLTTGMRLSDLANLNINSITGTTITIKHGKGNKARKVNISQGLVDMIEEYLATRNFTGEALFYSQKGNKLSTCAIQDLVKKYINKAGLDTNIYSTHKLRHTAATLMLQNKDDIATIRENLGHASLRTTQIYAHVLDETKQESANKMGDLFE